VKRLFHDLRQLLPGHPHRERPDKIEAIDMGRRGIHDEGSRTLQERLKGKVTGRFRKPPAGCSR